jgi:hypothetical protein
MNYAGQLEDMRKSLLRMLHVFLFENAKPLTIKEEVKKEDTLIKSSDIAQP